MGLLERWRKAKQQGPSKQQQAAERVWDDAPRGEAPAPQASTPTTSAPPAPARATTGVQQVSRHAHWIGPGTTTTVAGTPIPGGMLYIGRGLSSATNGGTEPALIDPSLKTNPRRPDHRGSSMGYWPSYHEITPEARAAYLAWLAGGRRDPHAYIGYVFLFFYGLERRALADIAGDPNLAWELPPIRAEVKRLIDLYRDNGSFRGYATRFLDVLDLQIASSSPDGAAAPPPLERENKWQPPTSLLVELGAFAADGRPVPADWALAWAWYHPEVHLRTPATRCTEEFAALFQARYTAAHGDGLVARPGREKVALEYYAASSGLRSASLQTQLPNVLAQPGPGRKLAAVATTAMEDLDAYSRYLGRNPDGRGTLGAAALLPAELANEPTGEVRELRDWAVAAADTETPVSGDDLMSRFPTKSPERMSKPETVALSQLLGHFGLGIEPDVRFGAPAITPATPVVFFRTGPQPPHSPTPAYAAATTLLHLATAVSAADGHVSVEEQRHLVTHLEASLHLTAGERARLEAHLRWLSATEIKLTGLKRRIEALTRPQREGIGDLLVTVAAADGVISPEEITSLTKIYQLLDLDPAAVHGRLHAHLTGAAAPPAPAAGPVTVRPAGTPDPGYRIHEPQPETGAASGVAQGGLALDVASIEAKFAETAAVSALLTDIFTDDEAPAPAPSGAADAADHAVTHPTAQDTPPVVGLDGAHSSLLRALAGQDAWTRAEFEDLVAQWDLMPDGALDTLNEASLDAVDEPFLEDEDTDIFTINDYARQELL